MNRLTKHPPHRVRWSGPAAPGVAVGVAALLLGACGSASHPATTATFTVAPIEAPCQQVAAVLSDGPDPDADPVGYAQAQVIQLRDLKLSGAKLHAAVESLASAYEQFAQTNASTPAKATLDTAVKHVNAICPGAAS